MKRYSKITPEGTRDLLFEECSARRIVEAALSSLFKSRGYNRIITPTIEFLDVFDRESAGLLPEDMYKLTDSNGRLMVLRPDNTLPIARVASTRLKGVSLPLRLYYSQKVFRQSPLNAGMNDEKAQSGIELIGADGIRADLEIITMAVDALNQCGAVDYRIEIGHAGFFKALSDDLDADDEIKSEISFLIESKNYTALNAVLDKIEDCGTARAIRMLPSLFGGEEVLLKASALCRTDEAKEALDYLKNVYNKLSALGLNGKVNIDLGLVHRNNYYTGVVFRGYIEGSGLTVLSGGRYDGLISEFGCPLSATGFGIEVDALANVLLLKGDVEPPKVADILVFGEDGQEIQALLFIRELTEKGCICETSVFDTLDGSIHYAKEKGIKQIAIATKTGTEIKDIGGIPCGR